LMCSTRWLAGVMVFCVVGLGSAHGAMRKIPRGVQVHWMNKSHTHGWATSPYQPRPGSYSLKDRRRLCGLAKYGTNSDATRVCETFDAGAHWQIAFTNHPRRGDDVTVLGDPRPGNFYFDVITAFSRFRGVMYVTGIYDHCEWTVRSVQKGYRWRNWETVEGSDQC
jgi:hypothetical protein